MRTLILAAVVAACRIGTPGTPSSPPSTSPSTPGAAATPAPSGSAELEQARRTWAASRPTSFAYTFIREGPLGPDSSSRYRVTVLVGISQAVRVSGADLEGPWPGETSIDGVFAAASRALAAGAQVQLRFDSTYGYPTEVNSTDPAIADSSWSETITDFSTR